MRRHEKECGVELQDFGCIPWSLLELVGDERIISLIRSGGYDNVIAENFTFD